MRLYLRPEEVNTKMDLLKIEIKNPFKNDELVVLEYEKLELLNSRYEYVYVLKSQMDLFLSTFNLY